MTIRTFEIKKGEDTRAQSRFHVKMIFGTRHVVIVDTKFKPLTRAMKLDVDETISESNHRQIFEEIVGGLVASGNMVNDESAACITFRAGTRQVEVPMRGGLN
jgi:hypothetical protein